MIAGILHPGSGLGNQLHRYVAIRVLAADKKYEWGMLNPHLFKGTSFMTIDTGQLIPAGEYIGFDERKVYEDGVDIRGYDPEFNFIRDKTIIDGEFQDERYFGHRLDDIREWLKVEPLAIPDDVCVINFRGGEYCLYPNLYLTKEYWNEAIEKMKIDHRIQKFEVHTDDVEEAKKFFPDYPITHDIGLNWRSIRYAKYLIIANSSFAILPSLLNENVETVIAPRYWARRNIKLWALPQNYYKKFTYI